MIKVSTVLKKNGSLSNQEFHRYWANEHNKVVLGTPNWHRCVHKYIQTHTFHKLDESQKPAFDGVSQLWFDRLACYQEWSQLKEVELIEKDEERFTEKGQPARLYTNELEKYSDPHWEKRSKIKRISFIRKPKDMPVEEFHHHWSEYHSQLVISRPWWKHCNRYVQNHIQYDAYPSGEVPFDYNGFAEIWFDNLDEFAQWQAGHVVDEVVVADEKRMVGSVDTFFTYEVKIQMKEIDKIN